MPPTFLLFLAAVAAAYASPAVLVVALVLTARRATRPVGIAALVWGLLGVPCVVVADIALNVMFEIAPVNREEVLFAGAVGFTMGAFAGGFVHSLLLVRGRTPPVA